MSDEFKKGLREGTLSPVEALEAFQQATPTVEKVVKTQASLNDRVFTPSTVDERHTKYVEQRRARETANDRAINFISPLFHPEFKVYPGLMIIGAETGRSKSTTSANIVAQYVKECEKPCIIISNEERAEDIYNRIACINLKINFNKFRRGFLDRKYNDIVAKEAERLIPRIEVVDGEGWDTTCLEDVQAVFEYAATANAGMIVLDYLQTVAFCRKKDINPIWVSKHLGLYLKDYAKRVDMPVIVFAQLKAKSEHVQQEFFERVQGDKTIVTHAHSAVEIIPDFDTGNTQFIVHKERFGSLTGQKISMRYNSGWYEKIDF